MFSCAVPVAGYGSYSWSAVPEWATLEFRCGIAGPYLCAYVRKSLKLEIFRAQIFCAYVRADSSKIRLRRYGTHWLIENSRVSVAVFRTYDILRTVPRSSSRLLDVSHQLPSTPTLLSWCKTTTEWTCVDVPHQLPHCCGNADHDQMAQKTMSLCDLDQRKTLARFKIFLTIFLSSC